MATRRRRQSSSTGAGAWALPAAAAVAVLLFFSLVTCLSAFSQQSRVVKIDLADCPGHDLDHGFANITHLIELCKHLPRCRAINSNGWVKENFTVVTCSTANLYTEVYDSNTSNPVALLRIGPLTLKDLEQAPWMKPLPPRTQPPQVNIRPKEVSFNTFEPINFQPRHQPPSRQHPGLAVMDPYLYTFGGIGAGGRISDQGGLFHVMDLNSRQWTHLNNTPPDLLPRTSLGLAAVTSAGRPPALVLFGGYTNNSHSLVLLDDTWLYTPSLADNKKWLKMTNLIKPDPSFGFSFVSYGEKAVLFGGSADKGACNCLWVFSYQTGDWQSHNVTASTPSPRWYHAAAMDEAGYMFVFGGQNDNHDPLDDLYMLNLAMLAWTALPQGGAKPTMNLQGVMGVFGSVEAKTAALYLIRADEPYSLVEAQVSSYSVADGTWSPASHTSRWAPPLATTFATSAVVVGDDIITVGGAVWLSGQSNFVYAYNRFSQTVTEISGSNMNNLVTPEPRVASAACAIGNDVFQYGGGGDTTRTGFNTTWMLSHDFVWTQIVPLNPAPHLQYHNMACFRQALFIFGGASPTGTSDKLHRFNLTTRAFEPIAVSNTPQHRMRGASAMDRTGLFYIHGGISVVNSLVIILQDLQVIDLNKPEGNGWITVTVQPGSQPPPLHSHTMSILEDKKGKQTLALYGGQLSSGEYSDQLWLMDLDVNPPKWQHVQPTSSSGPGGRALVMSIGLGSKLLIYGGNSDTTVWAFDREQELSWFQHGVPFVPEDNGDDNGGGNTPETAAAVWVLREDGTTILLKGFNHSVVAEGSSAPVDIRSQAFSYVPDCPAGYVAKEGFNQSSCLPCPKDFFAERGPLHVQCTQCPSGTTTSGAASTSVGACSVCKPNHCGMTGSCRINTDDQGVPSAECHCDYFFSGHRCGDASALMALIGCLIGAICVVVFVRTWFKSKRQRAYLADLRIKSSKIYKSLQGEQARTKRLVQRYLLRNSDIELLEEIGEGAFGRVIKAIFRKRKLVAIKVRKLPQNAGMIGAEQLDQLHKHFLEECQKCVDLPANENIVGFEGFGYLQGDRQQMFLVQDYANGGNLREYLERQQHQHLSEAEALNFLIQIVSGVRCLHKHHWSHRDIKPENYLIIDYAGVKTLVLSDFGAAMEMDYCAETLRHRRRQVVSPHMYADTDEETTALLPMVDDHFAHRMTARRGAEELGTREYSAPEVLNVIPSKLNNKFNWYMADIYAIGVIMCELISPLPLYPEEAFKYQPFRWRTEVVDNEMRPTLPPENLCSTRYLAIMQQCWDAEPAARPTAKELLVQLKALAGWEHEEEDGDE